MIQRHEIVMLLTVSGLVLFAMPVTAKKPPSTGGVPNPTNLLVTNGTHDSITLSWQSGGGSTIGFQIAYKVGTKAPKNITDAPNVNVRNVLTYTVSGLSPTTDYSFKVCAYDSDGSFSRGVTTTGTTDNYTLPPEEGDKIWEIEPAFENNTGNAFSCLIDLNGDVVVATQANDNAYLRKFDGRNGLEIEVNLFNTPMGNSGAWNRFSGICQDASGNLYVSGHYGLLGNSDLLPWVIKFDSDGNQIWEFFGAGMSVSKFTDIAVGAEDAEGNQFVYAVGQTLGPGNQLDAYVVKINTRDPTISSSHILTIDPIEQDIWNDVAVEVVPGMPDLDVIVVAGSSGEALTKDRTVAKFDANFFPIWDSTFKAYDFDGDNDTAKTLSVDSMGNIYLAGFGTHFGGVKAWWLQKLGPDGLDADPEDGWDKVIESSGFWPDGSAIDAFNNLYVVGTVSTNGGEGLIKQYNLDGSVDDTEHWGSYDASVSQDGIKAACIDPVTDDVVVVGYTNFRTKLWVMKLKGSQSQ